MLEDPERAEQEPTPEEERSESTPSEQPASGASIPAALGGGLAAPDGADSQALDPSLEHAEPGDGRAWYVVHCYSGQENKVRHNLEQRIETMGMKDSIFDIIIPTVEEIEVKEGKRRTVEKRVYPGYLMVQMILTEESWFVVRNTPGVTGFVGMGNTPTALRSEEVAQILHRMETTTPTVRPTYKAGQKVRIVDGPFNEFVGTVDSIDMDRGKVRVLVSFFGRETPVELDFLQVEKT
jgi:transcription termination/antitermination protein NusG